MRKELAVPEVERKLGVNCAKAGNAMILESVSCSFCCVLFVQTRWDELVVDVFRSHELLEQLRGFIVELLQLRLESSRFEDCDGGFLAICKMGFFCSAGRWFNAYEVRITLAQDKRALIAAGGWC